MDTRRTNSFWGACAARTESEPEKGTIGTVVGGDTKLRVGGDPKSHTLRRRPDRCSTMGARLVREGAHPYDPILRPLAPSVQPESPTACQTMRCRGCDCCAGTRIVLRGRAKHVVVRHFPRNNEQEELRWWDHRPRTARESAMPTRRAAAVMVSTDAWHLHRHRTPRPAQPTVSVPDMFVLRKPSPCRRMSEKWLSVRSFRQVSDSCPSHSIPCLLKKSAQKSTARRITSSRGTVWPSRSSISRREVSKSSLLKSSLLKSPM